MKFQNKANKFIHRLQHIPIACSGLALGLCGTSTLLDVSFQKFGWYASNIWPISSILLIFILTLLIIVTIKYCSHPKILKYELKDPLLCSFLPTYCMALMGVGGYIAGWDKSGITANQVIAAIFMVIAVLLQFIIIIFFIKNVIIKHNWHNDPFYGSWFVPTVGLCTLCTYTGRFNELVLPDVFFQVIWYFGFITYILMLAPATYAIIFKTKPTGPKIVSIAVYFAPANLTLASFMQTFSLNNVALTMYSEQFFVVFSMVLWIFGTVVYSILILTVIYILNKTKFSYIYAAISFPMAIGAVSQLFTTIFFRSSSWINPNIGVVSFGFYCVYSILALSMISYIIVRFFISLTKDLTKTHNDGLHHDVYKDEIQKNNIINN